MPKSKVGSHCTQLRFYVLLSLTYAHYTEEPGACDRSYRRQIKKEKIEESLNVIFLAYRKQAPVMAAVQKLPVDFNQRRPNFNWSHTLLKQLQMT